MFLMLWQCCLNLSFEIFLMPHFRQVLKLSICLYILDIHFCIKFINNRLPFPMSLSFMFFFFLIFVFFIDPLTASGKQALNYNRIHAMTKTAVLSEISSEEERQRENPPTGCTELTEGRTHGYIDCR